jgi:hypothetical protein
MALEKGLIQSMALMNTAEWTDICHGTGERAGPPQCPVVKYMSVPIGANFEITFTVYLE